MQPILLFLTDDHIEQWFFDEKHGGPRTGKYDQDDDSLKGIHLPALLKSFKPVLFFVLCHVYV